MKRFDKDKLIKLRESLELSQARMARILDVPRQSVFNWESGRNEPNASALALIATKFNISMDYFFTENISFTQERIAS